MKIIQHLKTPSRNGKRVRLVKAQCPACERVVVRLYSNARRQITCGCVDVRDFSNHGGGPPLKHGRVPRHLYLKWVNMRQRCYNKNNPEYADYGGRGISVCIEWMISFIPFRDWALNNGWEQGLEIHRVDNDGNYEPRNCSFLTKSQHSTLHNLTTKRY